MKSHTTPKRLLKQFAYNHPSTNSPRLWRYEKGRKPFRKASPHSDPAIAVDGHFADPKDDATEAILETRLAREIEEPVNAFMSEMANPSFVPTDSQRKALTRYITLLFNRSRAKREAAPHAWETKLRILEKFLANEQQILTVQAHMNFRLSSVNRWYDRLFSKEDVIRLARKICESPKTESSLQHYYASSVAGWLSHFDETMYQGEWSLLTAKPGEPFILSDAPVATWNRVSADLFHYGVGFSEPDVEVVLPVSPLTCWHILPKVQRTRHVKIPTVREVNFAQAAFATRSCFSNIESSAIDDLVQSHVSKAKLGVTAFTLWHMNYDNKLYDLLMDDAKWIETIRRVA